MVSSREEQPEQLRLPPGIARGQKVLESFYDLRSYDAGELANLILKTPFALAGTYGYDGKPASLCGDQPALWIVLKLPAKKGES